MCVVVVGVAQGQENTDTINTKASSIPGYVEPTSSTTAPPPVTTFRPEFRPEARAAVTHLQHFPRVSANPYFMAPYEPYSLEPARTRADGTTKSRAPVDAAFDGASGAVLDAGDKYTTLDRLQSERGAPPPLPRPQKHQLGGLHPDEVFYADDDLLIIKGGGFNSDAFEEPRQPLDDEDDYREGSPSRVSQVVVAARPSPHQEYNGNVPAIVPYTPSRSHHPFALFVGGASASNYVLVPYVLPEGAAADGTLTNTIDGTSPQVRRPGLAVSYVYPRPYPPFLLPVAHPGALGAYQVSPQHPGALTLPHSLHGDTDVNYRHPRPAINPDAELLPETNNFPAHYPGRNRRREGGRPRL